MTTATHLPTDRWFDPSAPWNRTAASIGTDASAWGARAVENFLQHGAGPTGRQGIVDVPGRDWSCPIYDVADATAIPATSTSPAKTLKRPLFQISGEWNILPLGVPKGTLIEWNDSWEPAPGNDRLMLIEDRAHPELGKMIELWIAKMPPLAWFWDYLGHSDGVGVGDARIYSKLWSGISATDVGQHGGWGGPKAAMTLRLDELLAPDGPQHCLGLYCANQMAGPLANPPHGPGDPDDGLGRWQQPAARLEWVNVRQSLALQKIALGSGQGFWLDITDANIELFLDFKKYTGLLRATVRKLIVCMRAFGWRVKETCGNGMWFEFEGFMNRSQKIVDKRKALGLPDNGGPAPLAGIIDGVFGYGTVRAMKEAA